ncbi:CHAT domain-containing protein [Oscillatoriales cyanobacterium LEGE 11467]|uniref:CHAT domain-containing protein n=1 Tax=Zarconia navalis LEGE 11467 TaxID=1828826 RepID=A0A928Z8J3_9CYAN|nr:CHAT domain-containing protein [Zarconia navalis]MBE9040614.1 CHAT domain-containing protein [Zarconia navalis LEGE 11467]
MKAIRLTVRWTVLSWQWWLLWVLAIVPSGASGFESSIPPQMILALESAALVPAQLVERGRVLYEEGRTTDAISLWQQAIDAEGEDLDRALAWSYLSLAYQDLGRWELAREAISHSLEITAISTTTGSAIVQAKTLNAQAKLKLALGQPEAAVDTWQNAQATYESIGDDLGALGSQINQAQALQALGLYRRASALLETTNAQLVALPDTPLKVLGLHNLGIALQGVGNLERSQLVLADSLALAQHLDLDLSGIFTSLGNTARIAEDTDAALDFYQQAAEIARNPVDRVEAQLNQLSLWVERPEDWETLGDRISESICEIQETIEGLPPSRMAIYARVNLAASAIELQTLTDFPLEFPDIARLTGGAVDLARNLDDPRAEAYALGLLGHLYEQTGQWQEAGELTQKALLLAKGIDAVEIAARWQWQLGRVLKAKGETDAAIEVYGEAVKTLQSLRSDLVAIDRDIQFSFRESVEPVYRELVSLLLSPSQPGEPIPQQNLTQARSAIEALQVAQLDNFFQEACLDTEPVQIDRIDPTAAVIYPIILPDRLAVILSRPNRPLVHYETVLPQGDIEAAIDELQLHLNPILPNRTRLERSSQLYDWLIRPGEEAIAASEIETLVFVLDGTLRNLPMAALYDGQRYLVERYQMAVAPGFQLLNTGTPTLEEKDLGTQNALAAGLTQAWGEYAALPGVEREVTQMASHLNTQILLDRAFTYTALQEQLDTYPFPVVHLATHGQFSSNVEETFLIAWDGPINVKALNRLLRERAVRDPIELLVLSACQTATGDSRAALGLAGFAVRSGARSTLATLWSVQDRSTAEFMVEFYRQLAQNPELGKAGALRQAQLSLLSDSEYHHPYYWAPFVLVGNWR